MTDATHNNTTQTAPGKKPLDPHLFSGSKGTVDDARADGLSYLESHRGMDRVWI
jgi:hypothetical protein